MSRQPTRCAECGAPIVLVLVIPTHLSKRASRGGAKRRYVPLDVDARARELSPAPLGVPPSHAVSPGWTTCHPITVDHPIDESVEYPAITHFATCPARARDRASTAPEGRTT